MQHYARKSCRITQNNAISDRIAPTISESADTMLELGAFSIATRPSGGDPQVQGLWSAQQTPVPSCEGRPLEGVGSLPAGHMPGVNEQFSRHVPRLASSRSQRTQLRALFRPACPTSRKKAQKYQRVESFNKTLKTTLSHLRIKTLSHLRINENLCV